MNKYRIQRTIEAFQFAFVIFLICARPMQVHCITRINAHANKYLTRFSFLYWQLVINNTTDNLNQWFLTGVHVPLGGTKSQNGGYVEILCSVTYHYPLL